MWTEFYISKSAKIQKIKNISGLDWRSVLFAGAPSISRGRSTGKWCVQECPKFWTVPHGQMYIEKITKNRFEKIFRKKSRID